MFGGIGAIVGLFTGCPTCTGLFLANIVGGAGAATFATLLSCYPATFHGGENPSASGHPFSNLKEPFKGVHRGLHHPRCTAMKTRSKMTRASPFERELGDRLLKIYDLGRKPRDPRDFFTLFRASRMRRPGAKKFVNLVESGKAVIGQANHSTKDWIILKSGKKVFTWCSYDTLMTAILQEEGEIGSSCPHCGEEMRILFRGGRLESFSPKGMIFLWGTGPEGSPGDPMCDHLHLFPAERHMAAWIESHKGEMGFGFRLEEAVNYLGRKDSLEVTNDGRIK